MDYQKQTGLYVAMSTFRTESETGTGILTVGPSWTGHFCGRGGGLRTVVAGPTGATWFNQVSGTTVQTYNDKSTQCLKCFH